MIKETVTNHRIIVFNTKTDNSFTFNNVDEIASELNLDKDTVQGLLDKNDDKTLVNDKYRVWYAPSAAYNVKAIPLDKIRANAYNPNHVPDPEMKLLYESIKDDTYTLPIVVWYIKEDDVYEIVDGYHRYTTMKNHEDIREREHGLIPAVVLDKDPQERMASTVRHNRARGKHDISLMANIVAELKKSGMSDQWIIDNVGLDPQELLRLKQVSGIREAFADKSDVDFSKAWV